MRVGRALRSWRDTSLAPLGAPLFRTIWIAAFASNIGASIQATAASWSMTTMAGSAQLVSLVQTAAMAPIVLLALPAGALADSADRRTLMVGAQVLGAAAAIALSVLAMLHLLNAWCLLALTSFVGAAIALYQPAWQASVIDLVPRAQLPAAIGLNVLAFNTARSIGPALGGLVIAVSGAFAAFAINAISFLGLILALAFGKFPERERRFPPEPMLTAIAGGLRFAAMSTPIKRTYLRASSFGFCASALYSLMPLIAHTRFPGGPTAFGLLMGSLGAGSLIGALSAASFRSRWGNQRITEVAVAVFGLAALGISHAPWLAAVVALALLAGFSWILVFTTTRTCIQLSSPRWVVGRSVSMGQVASFGAMSIGAAFWGFVATHLGIPETVLISGVLMLLSLSFRSIAALPETSLDDAGLPAARISRPTRTPVGDNDGPVVVTIEYEVMSDNAERFLALVNELGRVRRRNGATGWSLQQDVDNPALWVERIRCRTWLDHRRRLDRYSAADLEMVERLSAFRRTGGSVRRLIERRGQQPPYSPDPRDADRPA